MHLLAILAALAAPSGATDGKTMAVDDWHSMAIYGVGGEGHGPLYLQVHAGDLDADGRPDDAVVKLVCTDGVVKDSHYVISPRDAASGMPTGKRQHAPVTFVKEWGAATPQLSAVKPTYNVKKVEGARTRTDEAVTWTAIALAESSGLCAAAQQAVKATKTRSNIQNN